MITKAIVAVVDLYSTVSLLLLLLLPIITIMATDELSCGSLPTCQRFFPCDEKGNSQKERKYSKENDVKITWLSIRFYFFVKKRPIYAYVAI